MSVQADDEEIQNLEMQVSAFERDEIDSMNAGSTGTKPRFFSSKRSMSKTLKSIVTLTALDQKKVRSPTLMSPKIPTAEIETQTD
jgi:hypothetical protein